MIRLVIIDDEGRKTPVPLVRSEITIGRQEGNTIRLTERNVSRRHARIFRRDGRYFIEDLSRYGTRHEGVPLSGATPIEDAHPFMIGCYRVEVEFERAAPSERDEITATADPAPRADDSDDTEAATVQLDRGPVASNEPTARRDGAARLVCLSEPYVDTSFSLSGGTRVVGASATCTLIVDHPSIASEHARITRDGTSFRVERLDPAARVAINGVTTSDATAKPGDEIRLGDLRFQIVVDGVAPAAAPSASRPPAATAVLVDAAPRSMPLWIPLSAAAVVALIVLAVVLTRSPDPAAPSGAATAEGSGATPSPLAEGQRLMTAAQWDQAVAALSQVGTDGPDAQLAASLRARAESERENQVRYEAARQAIESGDAEGALQTLRAIPTGSYYHARADDELLERRAVGSVVAARVERSVDAQDRGDLAEARRIMTEVQALAPDHADIRARLQQLDALQGGPAARPAAPATPAAPRDRAASPPNARAPAASNPGRPAPGTAASPTTPMPPAPAAVESPEARAERAASLRQQAARAGVQQDFPEAIRLLEEARELNPGDAQINLMLFSNYRQIGNRSRAAAAIRRYLRQRPDDANRAQYDAWLAENAPE